MLIIKTCYAGVVSGIKLSHSILSFLPLIAHCSCSGFTRHSNRFQCVQTNTQKGLIVLKWEIQGLSRTTASPALGSAGTEGEWSGKTVLILEKLEPSQYMAGGTHTLMFLPLPQCTVPPFWNQREVYCVLCTGSSYNPLLSF